MIVLWCLGQNNMCQPKSRLAMFLCQVLPWASHSSSQQAPDGAPAKFPNRALQKGFSLLTFMQ